MQSDATFGLKQASATQLQKYPHVKPFVHSAAKFDPVKDYEIDLGPLGNEKQLSSYSRPAGDPYKKRGNVLDSGRDRQIAKEIKLATNLTVLQQQVSPDLARINSKKIPIRRHYDLSSASRGRSPATSPRIYTKIVKKPPQDISLSAMQIRSGERDVKVGSQSLTLVHSIKDILKRKRIKTFKNQYGELADKIRNYDQQNKSELQNPYIDSLEQVGSPDPQLERRRRKQLQTYLNPNQDNFGILTRTADRYDRESKHQLIHRSANLRAVA